MRSYKIVMGSKELDIKIYSWGDLRKERSTLYRFLSALGFLAVIAYIVAVPVIFYTTKAVPETMLMRASIVVALFLLFISLGMLILAGSKIYIDSPLLMTVLTFALLAVGAYLMASSNVRNTFGLDTVKYLSGSFIMSALGIYYFGILFTNTKRKLSLLKYLFLLVPVALCLIYVTGLLIAGGSIRLISLFVPVFLMGMLYLKDWRMRLLSIVGFILGLVINFRYGFSTYIVIPVVAELVAILVLAAVVQRGQLIAELRLVVPAFKSYWQSKGWPQLSPAGSFWVIKIVALIYIIAAVSWNWQNHLILSDFLNGIWTNITAVADEMSNVGQWLIGLGASLPLRTTTVADILQFQGLVGITAYVILVGGVAFLAARRFSKFLQDRDSQQNELFILFPLFIGLAVAGLMSVVTQLEAVIWWLALAVISAEVIISQRDLATTMLQKLRLRNVIIEGKVAWVQVLLIVILALIFGYFISLLGQQMVRGLL